MASIFYIFIYYILWKSNVGFWFRQLNILTHIRKDSVFKIIEIKNVQRKLSQKIIEKHFFYQTKFPIDDIFCYAVPLLASSNASFRNNNIYLIPQIGKIKLRNQLTDSHIVLYYRIYFNKKKCSPKLVGMVLGNYFEIFVCSKWFFLFFTIANFFTPPPQPTKYF